MSSKSRTDASSVCPMDSGGVKHLAKKREVRKDKELYVATHNARLLLSEERLTA